MSERKTYTVEEQKANVEALDKIRTPKGRVSVIMGSLGFFKDLQIEIKFHGAVLNVYYSAGRGDKITLYPSEPVLAGIQNYLGKTVVVSPARINRECKKDRWRSPDTIHAQELLSKVASRGRKKKVFVNLPGWD